MIDKISRRNYKMVIRFLQLFLDMLFQIKLIIKKAMQTHRLSDI